MTWAGRSPPFLLQLNSNHMKARKISNPFLKGNKAARKMQVRFFLSLMTIIALAFVVGMILDPDSTLGIIGFSGTSTLAAMAVIGDVDDVSDRKTHGSNIAYKVYLVDISQVNPDVAFPLPNQNREVSTVPMLPGQYMKYFMAHDIPTYTATGEKGDITTSGENNFIVIMGGMRDQLFDFIEQHAGGKFIVIFKEVSEAQWYILGNYDRPMVLSSYEAKNDKDGRYVTFTFKRTSIDQYYKYVGDIVRVPSAAHAADATVLTVKPANNRYSIPNGSAATYAIATVAGLTANDKGRYITLEGAGTDKAATVAESSSFILEEGATWTAKAGSSITFRVLDASTLIEIAGSRVQTA